MKGKEKSNKFTNAHCAKTLAIAEDDVGESKPLWQDGTWPAATIDNLLIVGKWGENKRSVEVFKAISVEYIPER